MPFFERLKSLFSSGGSPVDEVKRSKIFQFIRCDQDPEETWKIVGELGDGSFGRVYKAQHKSSGTFAALKQMEIKEEVDIEDYSVEIDILNHCRHQNVVGFQEAFYFRNKLWLYIEFCWGGALDSIMMDLERPLTEPQIRCVCLQMCHGLEFLHRNSVIHRDLKAGNVLLTSDAIVKLADFGVSARNNSPEDRRDSFIGTPYWMAPEVVVCETIKDHPYSYRADIWSLGITLIEYAQMEPPNHDIHPMRVLLKIQKSEPPKLNNPLTWSPEFTDFLTKCLIKEPELRWNASALLQHPFISSVADKQPIIELLCEAKADVTIEEKDIDEVEIKDDMFEGTINQSESFDEESPKWSDALSPSKKGISSNASSLNDFDIEVDQNRKIGYDKDSSVDDTSDCFEQSNSESEAKLNTAHQAKSELNLFPDENDNSVFPNTNILATIDIPNINNNIDNDVVDNLKVNKLKDVDNKKEIDLNEVNRLLTAGLERFGRDKSSFQWSGSQISDHPTGTNECDKSNSNKTPSGCGMQSNSGTLTLKNEQDPILVPIEESNLEESDEEELEKTFMEEEPGLEPDFSSDVECETLAIGEACNTSNICPLTDVIESASVKDALNFLDENINFFSTGSVIGSSMESSNLTGSVSSGEQRLEDRGDIFYDNFNEAFYSEDDLRSEDAYSDDNNNLQFDISEPINNNKHLHDVTDTCHFSPKLIDSPGRAKAFSSAKSSPKSKACQKQGQELNEISLMFLREVVKSNSKDFEQIENASKSISSLEGFNKSLPEEHLNLKNVNNSKSESSDASPLDWEKIALDFNNDASIYQSVVNQLVDDVITSANLKLSILGIACEVLTNEGGLGVDSKTAFAENRVDRNGYENHVNGVTEPERNESIGCYEKRPRYKSLTKTRTFMVNGVVQTSKVQKVVTQGNANKKQLNYNLWKADLRELKLLQKLENKQDQDLLEKHRAGKEQLLKKFETEKLLLLKELENSMEQILKQNKGLMEKMEVAQQTEMRNFVKKLKVEQEKELKTFRDGLKNEMKKLKEEVDQQPKEIRKELLKKKKFEKEVEHMERERKFVEAQQENGDEAQKSLTSKQRKSIAELERKLLDEKHNLLKVREKTLWTLEERQLKEMFVLEGRQLKDFFFLKRHQILDRQEKEMDLCRRAKQRDEEGMINRHCMEKKRLPKIQKADSKTRSIMFRQSLKIGVGGLSLEEEKEKIKIFEEAEKDRMMADTQRLINKHKKQWSELQVKVNASIKDLENIQNEKRRLLIALESEKKKNLSADYQEKVRVWRSELPTRMENLENEFLKQRLQQERFYSLSITSSIAVSTIRSRITND